jgi:hypothetical protein
MTSSLCYASSLNATLKSSIGENAELLTEKTRIRRNREHIRRSFYKDLEKRKKMGTSVKFQLPRHGPEHELYIIEDGMQARYGGVIPSRYGDNFEDLDHFEGRLNKSFK